MIGRARPMALAGLLAACAACTPTRFHLQPYRDDPDAARALVQRAASACADARGPAGLPPHPFTSDGCSVWPDGTWADCCVEHDIAYWCGGTAQARQQADARLRECVAARRTGCLGGLMYAGVRIGGVPWQPFPWRWAYGWDGVRGYDCPASPTGAPLP